MELRVAVLVPGVAADSAAVGPADLVAVVPQLVVEEAPAGLPLLAASRPVVPLLLGPAKAVVVSAVVQTLVVEVVRIAAILAVGVRLTAVLVHPGLALRLQKTAVASALKQVVLGPV